MSLATASWPCPACSELIPDGYHGCPHCRLSADWLDLLHALEFAVRRFLLWKLEGALSAAQYHALAGSCHRHLDGLVGMAKAGRPVPADTGLPPRCVCWSCDLTCHPSAHYCPDCSAPLHTPEVRLLRYQQFVAYEVERQQQKGRLNEAEARHLLAGTPERLTELRGQLDRARFLVSSR